MTQALTLKSSTALVPALTSSLAQLQPVMAQTQEKLQGLVVKVTDALASSEERGRKLEAELIAAKAQQAADKATHDTRQKSQDALIDTLQKTVAIMQKRMTALEEQTKYIRPAIKTMIRSGGSIYQELDYPGKKDDLELRKPVLQAEITALKLTISKMAFATAMEKNNADQKLASLRAEAARIAAFEIRKAQVKE